MAHGGQASARGYGPQAWGEGQTGHSSPRGIPDYLVHKGRVAAMNHFARCILSGATPENTSAEDAWRACLFSQAAIRNRDVREVVTMEDPR